MFASVIVLNYQDLAGYAKKFGYLPTDSEHLRYYLTCLVEQADLVNPELIGDPIGIDLGLKEFAILMMALCIITRTKAVK